MQLDLRDVNIEAKLTTTHDGRTKLVFVYPNEEPYRGMMHRALADVLVPRANPLVRERLPMLECGNEAGTEQ